MGSKKVKTTSNETAVTKPNTPAYIEAPVQNYFGQIQGLFSDPKAYTTPANDLQTGAGQAAGNLGGWQAGLNQSNAMAQGAAGAGPQYVTPSLFGGASAGQAQQASVQGYTPQQAQASLAGTAQTVTPQGYTAAQMDRVNLSPVERAQAQSLLTNFDRYQNPATDALVKTTLADFDASADQTRAQQAAAAARNKAFGGSRFAIQEAQTEGELSRARASTDAQLRDRAFSQAVGMSQFDAANRQQASLANAQMGNQHSQYQAGLDQQRGLFNTGAQNDASAFFANAGNNASMFNAGQTNDMARLNAQLGTNVNLANAQFGNDANRFSADAQNQASMFNTGQANQLAQTNAGFAQQAGLAGMDATNRGQEFNAGLYDNALGRQLQAAGLMGQNANTQAGNARADVSTQMEAGNNLWNIANQNNRAPLDAQMAYAALLNPGLIGSMTGQTINSSGTSTQKQSGGLLGSLLGAGLSGWATGGFKL